MHTAVGVGAYHIVTSTLGMVASVSQWGFAQVLLMRAPLLARPSGTDDISSSEGPEVLVL